MSARIAIGELTIGNTRDLLSKGEVSVRELVAIYEGELKQKNAELNAYAEVFPDAFDAAEAADKRLASGDAPRPLEGVIFAIKDNILIRGKHASAASKMLESYRASYDATAVARLREAGAIFLGRTNMDEFAMGSSTEYSLYGPAHNPHDTRRVAGGSSGGSAVAVAANMAMAALGSDTGGSIRQPAGFCGVVGLKPTYGAVSRSGLMAMASSFDQIGPFAKTVRDAETIFDVIKGKDPRDATSVEYAARGMKREKAVIGVIKGFGGEGVDTDVKKTVERAVETLREAGHTIKEIPLPHERFALAAYYILVPAEVSANLARFDGVRYGLSKEGPTVADGYFKTRAHGFGAEVRRRIALGTYVLSAGYYDAYYVRASRVRELIRRDFKKAFEDVDCIVSPVSPAPAFKLGEKTDDPLAMYLEDIFLVPVNLAGIPALSLPYGVAERDGKKLPVGIQLMAPWFGEKTLFDIGAFLEAHR